MKRLIGSILYVCLFVSATTAFGGVKEGSFSVTPLVGGYIYDSDQHTDTSLVLGARAGYNFTKAFGVEAVYDYVTRSDASAGPFTDVSLHRFGGQALYHFFPDNEFVPYLAAGYSGINFNSDADAKTHGAFDYGAGFKFFLIDDVALRGDVRHILYKYDSRTNHNVEFTLGAYFQFGAAEPAMKPAAAAPAPPPPPEPVQVITAPVPVAPADSDGDGVIDTSDKCPDTPHGVSVDSYGCPLDSDNDGVPDYLDKCPGTQAGVAVDANGCPAEIAKQHCNRPAVIAITFDTNKADIKTKYHAELDTLGSFLKEFPHAKGTIEGHTDADGSKAANLKLSQSRADSVRNYFITKFGIDGSRITAIGYGEDKPVASNKTAAGKAQNRRIEAVFTCD